MVALQNLIGFDRPLEDGGHEVIRRVGVENRRSRRSEVSSPHRSDTWRQCFTFEKLLFADEEPAIWLRECSRLVHLRRYRERAASCPSRCSK